MDNETPGLKETISVNPKTDIVIIFTPGTSIRLDYMREIRIQVDECIKGGTEGQDVPRFLVLPAGAWLQIMELE